LFHDKISHSSTTIIQIAGMATTEKPNDPNPPADADALYTPPEWLAEWYECWKVVYEKGEASSPA
jgi:hypothetical protein